MLTTNQQQRNPSARERQVLAALASGASRQEAAALTGLTPRAVTAILERLRDRYAPTLPALIAIAVKLEWIPVPIWTMPGQDPPPPIAPADSTAIHTPTRHPNHPTNRPTNRRTKTARCPQT